MIARSRLLTRILVVDDKDLVRRGLRDRIEASVPTYRVATAASGEEAVERLAAEDFDVVLCDLKLRPGFDGVEVTRRAQQGRRRPRVVVFTGRDEDRKADALAAGAFSYLSKPVDYGELLHTIEVVNEIRRTERFSEWFETLARLSADLQQGFDLDRLAASIVRGAAGLGYRRARLYLMDRARAVLVGRAERGDGLAVAFPGYEIPVAATPVLAEVFARPRPTLWDRAALERLLPAGSMEPWMSDLGLAEVDWVDCPLWVENQIVGLVSVDNRGRPDGAFTDDDLEILALLAGMAAQAVANCLAYEREALAAASLRSILRDAPDAIVTTDLHGVINFASPSAESVTGHAAAEMVGQPAGRYYTDAGGRPAVGREVAQRVMADLRRLGRLSNRPVYLLDRQGRPRPVALSASLLHDPAGQEVGTLGVLKEVSAFEGHSQKYRDLLEGFGYGSALLAVDGSIEFVNRKAEHLLRRGRGDLLGVAFATLVLPAQGAAFAAALARVGAGEEEVGIDFSAVRPDGSRLPLQARLTPILREGRVRAVALALYDKSELSALIQSGRLMALGQIVAGVAHEIKNPLNNLLANLGVLREELGGVLAAPAAGLYDRAVQNAARIDEIVDRMKEFSRAADFRLEPLALARLVADAVAFFDRRLANHNVEIATSLAPDLPPVRGDRTRLMQVFVALIVNAEEAMEDLATGKRIVIEAAAARPGRAVVWFRDTGPGIAEGIREAVFDPFFTTKLAGKGTGLGLSIRREILAAHGGTIEIADGGPGWGACFRLELPLAAEAEAEEGER